MNKRQSYSSVILFCVLIFGFTAATVIKSSSEFSETENRVLAQRPKINLNAILNGEFEEDYVEYMTDQFILRDGWIGLKTSVEKILLKKESKDIYFADDDYLIEKHTGIFTTDMAQRNMRSLAQFTENYTKQFDAQHISVMIIPNAADILKNKLPYFASPYDEEEYLKQISNLLPKNVWFDAASVLREHTDEELYYRTDHHWKTLAAFYVYQQWAKEQGFYVPELTDYNIETAADNFEGTIQSKLGIKTKGDTIELFHPKREIGYTVYKDNVQQASLYDYPALNTKDKYAVYFGGNQPFIKIHTQSESKRKILIIKDSYANCFIPFMLKEFTDIDIFDLRYTNQKLSELIADEGYTDILILYNAAGFAEDMSITKLAN